MDAYRTTTQPTPQHKPRMEWCVGGDELSLGGTVLVMCSAWFAFAWAFVRDGLEPYVMRWALMNIVATLAWCACFVRRREVTP